MAKYIKTEEGYKDLTDVIKPDKWQNYDIVICLSDIEYTMHGIANNNSAPRIVKGNYESVKNALTDYCAVSVYIYAHSGTATKEFKLDYVFLDEDNYFVFHVHKDNYVDTARMYLSPQNTVSLEVTEWKT